MKMVYADNVDANGKAWETVGENIRNGAKSGESSAIAELKEDMPNEDRIGITENLSVDGISLKNAILELFSGEGTHFGGLDVSAFTTEEKTSMKTWFES